MCACMFMCVICWHDEQVVCYARALAHIVGYDDDDDDDVELAANNTYNCCGRASMNYARTIAICENNYIGRGVAVVTVGADIREDAAQQIAILCAAIVRHQA